MRHILGLALLGLLVLAGCRPTPPAAPAAPAPARPAPGERAEVSPAAAPAAPPSAVASPQAPRALTVAQAFLSAQNAPFWAALDEGIFLQHGLAVEFVNLDGGARSVPAIVSGEAPIGIVNGASVLDARLQGADVSIVGLLSDRHGFQIYAHPSVRTPADLRGRKIAAGTAGSATDRAAQDALGPLSLASGRDYELLFLGAQNNRLAALEQGVADAAMISAPFGLRARAAGYVEVLNLLDIDLPFASSVIASTDTWLRANGEVTSAFLRGYAEGLTLVKRDREVAKRVIGKYTRVDDPALLEESYTVEIPRLPEQPWVREEIVRATLQGSELPAARAADPRRFYDNRYLEVATASPR